MLGALPDGMDGLQGREKCKGARRVEGVWHASHWWRRVVAIGFVLLVPPDGSPYVIFIP